MKFVWMQDRLQITNLAHTCTQSHLCAFICVRVCTCMSFKKLRTHLLWCISAAQPLPVCASGQSGLGLSCKSLQVCIHRFLYLLLLMRLHFL